MNEAAYRAILKRLGVQGSKPTPDADLVMRLIGMPLDQFAQEGYPLAVQVPWWPEPLWFVPGEVEAESLAREGISRGRVWTALELMDLLAISGLTQEQTQTIAKAKLDFGGEVVEIRPRRREEDRS